MKKLFVIALAAIVATACFKNNNTSDPVVVKFKYTDRIIAADGSTVSLEYDANKRVSRIVCAGETFGDRTYDVAYNIGAAGSASSTTVAVKSDDGGHWVMKFNDAGNIKSWSEVDDGGRETLLSSFDYYYAYNTPYLINAVTEDGTGSIEWSTLAPSSSTNIEKEGLGEYDRTNYRYEAVVLNLHTNVDLFMMVSPDYLKFWNIDPVLAMSINVFGMRSYYMPSSISVYRSAGSGNDATSTTTTRSFSYDCDEDGIIQTIYAVDGDNRSRVCTVEYFEPSTAENVSY